MTFPESTTAWFSLACQVARTPDSVLRDIVKMKRAALCSYRKIAKLHPVIGNAIDELHVPLQIAKRIAHAPPAEQWERAQEELAALVERRGARSAGPRLYEVDLLAELQKAIASGSR